MKTRSKAVVAAGAVLVAGAWLGSADVATAQPQSSPALVLAARGGSNVDDAQQQSVRAVVGFVTSTARHLASTRAIREQVSSVGRLAGLFGISSTTSSGYGANVDEAFDR